MDSTATVNVASAWLSKINWTQAVGGISMLAACLSGGKIGLSAEQQAAIVTVIGLIQGAVTWFFRTYRTTTVTPASVESTPPDVPPILQEKT